MKEKARLFLTGFGMGAADIVPGVSGGTIAFIFGIYEELIYSIKKLSGEIPRLVLQGKIKEALKETPFTFLVPLGLGVVTAFASLASLLSHLLETQPTYVWSFFFGLVVASILIVKKRVVTWDLHDFVLLLIAAAGAYYLVGSVPVETPATPLAFLLSGAIAIIAMILPGISGSFILVLLGKYEQVLNAVVDLQVVTLVMVAVGAVIGLAVFSRILSWLFSNHHDISVVVLTGFMIGSLRKIWPWKETLSTTIDRHGVEVPLEQLNIIPAKIDATVWFALLLSFAAFAMMMYLDSKHVVEEDTHLVHDPDFEKEHKKALQKDKHS